MGGGCEIVVGGDDDFPRGNKEFECDSEISLCWTLILRLLEFVRDIHLYESHKVNCDEGRVQMGSGQRWGWDCAWY